MDINQIYASGGDYLKAEELRKPDGSFHRIEAVIESHEVKDFAKEDSPKPELKVVLKLVGKDKLVVLNKTNGLILASAYGADTNGWNGKTLLVTGHMVNYQGQLKPGVKVDVPYNATPSYAEQEAASANAAAGPDADPFGDDDIPF